MIRDFWVENYLSIRDRQGLDFVSKTQDEFLCYEVSEGVFLNKLGILYGADSYGLHKNVSLYNSYKIGRLGAKPALGSYFIDLD